MPLGIEKEKDYAHAAARSLHKIADDVDRLGHGAIAGRDVHPEMEAISEHLARIAETLNKAVGLGSVDKPDLEAIAAGFEGIAKALL